MNQQMAMSYPNMRQPMQQPMRPQIEEGPSVMLKSSQNLTSVDLQTKKEEPIQPQPVEINNESGEVLPGSNTVEEDVGEFNHPMFSLTSGVYDGQRLAGEECRGMGRQLCNQKQLLT